MSKTTSSPKKSKPSTSTKTKGKEKPSSPPPPEKEAQKSTPPKKQPKQPPPQQPPPSEQLLPRPSLFVINIIFATVFLVVSLILFFQVQELRKTVTNLEQQKETLLSDLTNARNTQSELEQSVQQSEDEIKRMKEAISLVEEAAVPPDQE